MIAQLTPQYVQRRPVQALKRLIGYGLFEGRAVLQRGRWINPAVFALFALEARLPQLRQVRQPVFIVGLGRSGTTILSHVLSYHRHVGSLNEPKALWHAVIPDDDLIGSYTRGPARYRLGAEDVSPAVSRRAHRLYGAYLFATHTRRIVDKYPEMIFRVPFLRAIFPDTLFLFLTRNGWDVCGSISGWSRKHATRAPHRSQDWWGVDDRKWRLLVDQVIANDPDLGPNADTIRRLTDPANRGAVEWVTAMREGLRLLEEIPEAMLRVSYEDLVQSPGPTVATILEFIGVEQDAGLIDYATDVLRPSRTYRAMDLDSTIRPTFEATMTALGY